MAGAPGSTVNNPEGFVEMTTQPAQITIVTDNLMSAVVPLSVLPFWRNDGGVRSYGGAKYISIFADGVPEGTSTTEIAAVTQQPIEQVGTFTVDASAVKLFRIRIRLRSALSDPNYKDYVFPFRINTPTETPMEFSTFDDADLPELSFNPVGSDFSFATLPPTTEIRLRSDGDGIVLPTTTAVFPPVAKAWLLGQLQQLRDGVFVIDFLRSGTVEATARVVYAYRWNGSAYIFKKIRRRDFPDWNQYSGTDFGICRALITQPAPASQIVPLPETDTAKNVDIVASVDTTPLMHEYVILPAAGPIVPVPKLYMLANGSGYSFALHEIDYLFTGNATRVGLGVAPAAPICWAYCDDVDGFFVQLNTGFDRELWIVDRVTGAWTLWMAQSAHFNTLAYDPETKLFRGLTPFGFFMEIDFLNKSGLGLHLGSYTIPGTFEDGGFDYRTGEYFTIAHEGGGVRKLYGITPSNAPFHIGPVGVVNYGTLADNDANDAAGMALAVDIRGIYRTRAGAAPAPFFDLLFIPLPKVAVATLEFVNNLYGTGPNFETLLVIGNKGAMHIPPNVVKTGGKVFISPVIDSSDQRFLSRLNLDDQYVMLVGVTDSQMVVRQIPLWDIALSVYAVGGKPAIANMALAPTYLLNSRLLVWPFVEFPNLTDFFDPTPAGPGGFPNVLNVRLFNQNGVNVATFADGAALWAALVSVRMPDAGVSRPALDVRALLTATDSFYVIEATIDVDGTVPNQYTVRQTFPLNVDGEPLMWVRADLDVIEEMPTFQFNKWGKLSITTPGVWTALTGFSFESDVGIDSGALQGASTTVEYDLTELVMSRLANYVIVSWQNASNILISLRIPTTVQKLQLQRTESIDAFLNGNTIMFPTGSLANVATSLAGKRVVLVADVGSLSLENVTENTVYRLGLWGKGSQLLSNPAHPYVDIHFTGAFSGFQNAVRIANTFFDYREQGTANGTFALKNRGGIPTGGLKSIAYAFNMPKMRYIAATNSVEFEDDGSLALYDTRTVVFINGRNGLKKSFQNALQLGVGYQLAEVGRDIGIDDFIFVSAVHKNGYTTTVMYRLSATYAPALKVTPEGTL